MIIPPRPKANTYQRNQLRRMKTLFNSIVSRVTVTAVGSTTVDVQLYDGTNFGTVARMAGPYVPVVGDEGYLINTTGDPVHPGWLFVGAAGGFKSAGVYHNVWSSGTETSTTNTSTPVAALNNTWTLPTGNYYLILTATCGMRVNAASQGYLGIRVNGTIVSTTQLNVPQVAATPVEPIPRAPVSDSVVLSNQSGSIQIELIFRGVAGASTTTWCYCPIIMAIAQRAS